MLIFIQSLLSYMLLTSARLLFMSVCYLEKYQSSKSDSWLLAIVVKCKQANILEFKKNLSALVVLFCNTWIQKELALCSFRATYTGCVLLLVLKQEIKTQKNFNPSKMTWKIKNKKIDKNSTKTKGMWSIDQSCIWAALTWRTWFCWPGTDQELLWFWASFLWDVSLTQWLSHNIC